MGVHVYCIVPADLAAAGYGIADQPVRALVSGPLAAWYSEHAVQPPATLESMRRHDAVIRSACSERVTPVPLRFGQWFASDDQLRARVLEQQQQWLERLAEFTGCAEYGVRIAALATLPLPPEPDPAALPQQGRGRAYLERLAARTRAQDDAATAKAELLRVVAALTSPWVLREASGNTPEGVGGLWVAHLVRRRDAETYREALAALPQRLPEYRVVVTGPWPPYSFAAS